MGFRACVAVLAFAATVGSANVPAAAEFADTAPHAEHASVAASAAGEASAFGAEINGLRSSRGLPALAVHGELVGVAQAWTQRMADAGEISHNPTLASDVDAAWLALGENVGVGPNVDNLFDAFVDSPPHFANLVDASYTHVGVGIVWVDGLLYTTHNFMQLAAAPAPPPKPPTEPATGPGSQPPTTPDPGPAARPGGGGFATASAPAPQRLDRVARMLAELRRILV